MKFLQLEKNIINVIKEEQLKLGYRKEVVRLYYPVQSLNRFLKADLSVEQMQGTLEEYFGSEASVLGAVGISHVKERFCLLIPESGVDYVHEHTGTNEFIREFIDAIGNHGCRIEDLVSVFQKHSSKVHFEKMIHEEFDYLIYFEDGQPDDFWYCITDEGCHLIYHRFTPDDFAEMYGKES